jgi:hypothetical protein
VPAITYSPPCTVQRKRRAAIFGEMRLMIGPQADDRTGRDIVTICPGMADMASTSGETDLQSIEDRILKAVFGYLDTEALPADI